MWREANEAWENEKSAIGFTKAQYATAIPDCKCLPTLAAELARSLHSRDTLRRLRTQGIYIPVVDLNYQIYINGRMQLRSLVIVGTSWVNQQEHFNE